jgi:hypothetical protein
MCAHIYVVCTEGVAVVSVRTRARWPLAFPRGMHHVQGQRAAMPRRCMYPVAAGSFCCTNGQMPATPTALYPQRPGHVARSETHLGQFMTP